MNQYKKRLRLLRAEMKKKGIDAYLIPGTDPHFGENIQDYWKIVRWLTGFSGSGSTVLVTKSFAGLWTDPRYHLQAVEELEGTGFELMPLGKPGCLSTEGWLLENLKKGGIIAFDGRIVSSGVFRLMRDRLMTRQPVFATEADLVSVLWENRPSASSSTVFEHTAEFSGISREEKILMVRQEMEKRRLDFHLINAPDDIMWLLNIRGSDVRYSPLLVCRAIISCDQVLLFAEESKFPPKLAHEFDMQGIVILPSEEVNSVISSLPAGSRILLDENMTSVSLTDSVHESMETEPGISIPSKLKAVKNETELKNLRQVMIRDGVALTRFFKWLEENSGDGKVTEEAAAGRLLELRLLQRNCTGESFEPIIAWKSHGALPHYSFKGSTGTVIGNEGTLLADTGGQYLDGTTDVTRCVAFSEPSKEMRRDFTLALKGMIALACAKFPEGTRGSQLDVLARIALWENGTDYGHGTGHGVGYFLNVHEAPPSVSKAGNSNYNMPLRPGMILSDEPAVYREGRYGFRTENLLLVREDCTTDSGLFLSFETLTLCYIDTSLVDKPLLDSRETAWINDYNSKVFESLSGFLSPEEKSWLLIKTASI